MLSPHRPLPPPRRPRRLDPEAPPSLRFTPYAWAKLTYLRDAGPTEIGGFGLSDPHDLLLIQDVCTVAQTTTSVTVAFDDAAVADYVDAQVDQGRNPNECFRIWLHTHPGSSATPSSVDEETFERVFGRCDWAIMAILARGGQTYARLRFAAGPGGALCLPVEVDFTAPFAASDIQAWQAEYDAHVHLVPLMSPAPRRGMARRNCTGDRASALLEPDMDADTLLAWLEAEESAASTFPKEHLHDPNSIP